MPAKANISPGYRWRLGIIALMLLAFAGWFFYDGLIGYPAYQAGQAERYEAYQELQQQHPSDYTERWDELATERGWAVQEPEEPMPDSDIYAQFMYGGACVLIGLPFLIFFIRASGRWIASDENGLLTSSGQRANWDQLKSINTDRLRTKGIAVVHYLDSEGTERRITLDDWKYDRGPTETITREAREAIEPEALQAEMEQAEMEQRIEADPNETGVGDPSTPPMDETREPASASDPAINQDRPPNDTSPGQPPRP